MQLLCVCGEGEGHCNGVTPPLRKELSHPPAVITPPETIMLTPAHIQPLAALIGGILILLVPRLLNYVVAIYLILIGIMGLGVRFH